MPAVINSKPKDRAPRPGRRGLRRKRLLCLLALLPGSLLLGACATAPQLSATGPGDALAPEDSTVEQEAAALLEPPVLERPIPPDSVYPLLVAEFALRRGEFGTALRIYLQQAEKLRDPGVSKHATNLAQYLRQDRVALRAVSQWIEIDPENLEANATRGALLAGAGQPREALRHLAFVARKDQKVNFPVILRGIKAVPGSERAGLDADIQMLLDKDLPDNLSLRLTHALLAESSGEPEDALLRLEEVFALEPYLLPALLLDARLRQVLEKDAPLARIEEALEADPARSELRLQYARLLARDDVAAARVQFERLSRESPDDSKLLFSLAMLNHELGDNTTARQNLQRVLDLGERSDEAWQFLGQIARDEGKIEEALQHFRQVGDGEELVGATVNIGNILLEAERDDEFSSYMLRLRQSYPRRREQLYGLEANLFSGSGREARGLELLNEAIGEYPQSDDLYYSRSILLERSGDIDAAERDLRSILARDPNNATALNALGYTLANRTARYAEAQQLIEKALALQPNEPAILDSMGWVLFQLGEHERSLEFLARAYARFPDPEVAAHLGEVMWATGDTSGAMAVWRNAYEQDPSHQVLNDTLQRLGVDLNDSAEP